MIISDYLANKEATTPSNFAARSNVGLEHDVVT